MRNVLKGRCICYRGNTAITQHQCARLADLILNRVAFIDPVYFDIMRKVQ